MNMKELKKVKDITTLRTDKKNLIGFLVDRDDFILPMVKTNFIDKDKLFEDLMILGMSESKVNEYMDENNEFEYEFDL